MNSSNYSLY